MRRTDEPRYNFKPTRRTSQIIYGERQHLRAVLVSLGNFKDKYHRFHGEAELLHRMIDARTAELERINPKFDQQLRQAQSRRATAEQLVRLAQDAPQDDWLLLRSIAEHPHTPAEVLAVLAQHPYDAVKENVARHPNADAATLEKLAAHPARELWSLVAENNATPAYLRDQLRARQQLAAAATAVSNLTPDS